MFCTYGEFSRISIVLTILCIFFPHYLVAEQYIPFLCDFYQSSLCPMQSPKPASRGTPYVIPITATITTTEKNLSYFPLRLTSMTPSSYRKKFLNPFIKLKQRDADKLLFMMRGNGSLGSRHFKTSHSSSRRRNTDNASSEGEFIEV